MTPRQAAVLGCPVGHSLSPVLHAAAYRVLGLDWSYGAHEVDGPDLAGFLAALDESWAGLSLTMPLKRVATGLCTELGETAAAVGAVNTITFPSGGRRGDNTDVPGMVNALAESGVERESVAAVLGGGATAASTVAALVRLGVKYVDLYARSPERAQPVRELAQRLGVELVVRPWDTAAGGLRLPLVIATTPGGAADALAEHVPAPCGVLFDVAYDPWPTPLGAAWQAAGGLVLNGLELLVHQAVIQVELMTGRTDLGGQLVPAMRSAGLAALAVRRGG